MVSQSRCQNGTATIHAEGVLYHSVTSIRKQQNRKLTPENRMDLPIAITLDRELGPWNTQLALSFFLIQVATAALELFGAFRLRLTIAVIFGSPPIRSASGCAS